MSEPLEILAVIAIIAYVIGRQLMGEALRGKRVVLLPVILTVIGIADLGGKHEHASATDVTLLVVGGVIVAVIGLAQGAVMRLESRNGSLWGQLPVKGLWLWLILVLSRVLITVLADGDGAKVAASSSAILLMLGVNRLAQAAVIFLRSTSAGIAFAPEKDGTVFLSRLDTRRRG